LTPSQTPQSQAATLEPLTAATWAKVVAAELFLKLLAVNEADSALDFRFRWVAFTTFAHWLESKGLRRGNVGCRIALVCSGLTFFNSKCSRQESNLIYDLRKVACVFGTLTSRVGW